jgi:hypothetical protein
MRNARFDQTNYIRQNVVGVPDINREFHAENELTLALLEIYENPSRAPEMSERRTAAIAIARELDIMLPSYEGEDPDAVDPSAVTLRFNTRPSQIGARDEWLRSWHEDETAGPPSLDKKLADAVLMSHIVGLSSPETRSMGDYLDGRVMAHARSADGNRPGASDRDGNPMTVSGAYTRLRELTHNLILLESVSYYPTQVKECT